MDDLTVTTESVAGCQWILQGLEKLMEWAQMHFKPAKFWFRITGTAIPTITVKSLGKVFDNSLRDIASIQLTCTELDAWLKSVDSLAYLGSSKHGYTSMAFFPESCGPPPCL